MAADIFKPPICGITKFWYGSASEFHHLTHAFAAFPVGDTAEIKKQFHYFCIQPPVQVICLVKVGVSESS